MCRSQKLIVIELVRELFIKTYLTEKPSLIQEFINELENSETFNIQTLRVVHMLQIDIDSQAQFVLPFSPSIISKYRWFRQGEV